MTWLDTVSRRDLRQSLAYVDTLPDQAGYLTRADGNKRFALWLRLADQHAAASARETLHAPVIKQQEFPWKGAFLSGWSPRGAAEAAHDGLKPRELIELRKTAERDIQPPANTPSEVQRDKRVDPEREL
jgi:hypothetical protein